MAYTDEEHFNSHLHEEDDGNLHQHDRIQHHFNSHPHEEDDVPQSRPEWTINISTHILTKRITIGEQVPLNKRRNFNSHPHEEDDGSSYERIYIDAKFQLTSSRRGWLWLVCFVLFTLSISTHILTKRMTYTRVSTTSTICIFQLTSSRRGWQQF